MNGCHVQLFIRDALLSLFVNMHVFVWVVWMVFIAIRISLSSTHKYFGIRVVFQKKIGCCCLG